MSQEELHDDSPPELKDLTKFLEEYNRESDRGSVLVAASRFDEVLKSLLVAFFRNTDSSREILEGFNAPLGTFAARASTCHALGLLEDHEFYEITLLRRIRNEFGHKWRDITFETDKIRDLVIQLPWLGPENFKDSPSLRLRFTFAVTILQVDLLWRQRLVQKEQRAERRWPSKIRNQF